MAYNAAKTEKRTIVFVPFSTTYALFAAPLQQHALTIRLRVLLVVLCVFGAQSGIGAELHVIRNQLPVALGQYLDHYEDPGATLGIDQILAGGATWERSSQNIPTLGISKSAHWFYITLTSDDRIDEDLMLSLDSAVLDRVEFYFVRDGRIVRELLVGDTIPVSQLSYPFRTPAIQFNLNAGDMDTRIYFRAISSTGVEIPLTLTTVSQFAALQQNTLLFLGALLALFTLCFASCAIVLYFMRDKPFFAFTLFFGSAVLFFLAQSGLGRLWLWGEHGEANSRIGLFASCLLVASLCLIGQIITLHSRYRDLGNIVLRFLTYGMFLLAVYFLVIPFEQISAENVIPLMILALLIGLSVLTMAGITALQGSRTALYLFSSWLLMLLAYSSFLVYKLNLIERAASASVTGQTLSIGSALLLLMAIAEFIRAKNEEFLEARIETKAKGDFLRNVSREFLTPVHLILANSKRLLAANSSKLDEPTRQHMTTVVKQSDHLQKLINDLLEMAELESDSFEPEFDLVEISHFLNEVRNMILPSALEKKLEITTQFAAASLLVQTDRARLQHALMNVLMNSIKYTEQGSIQLGYKAVYFRRKLGIEIFIQDTGRGMSEEFQQRLFQEFAREEEFPEQNPDGTGLGLVIVKRMVERLGGTIDFQSQKGEGSTFYIRLPLRAMKG